MRAINKVFLCLLLLMALGHEIAAKEWRSIIPLHSTRDDVTRLLGQPDKANDGSARYILEKEEVLVLYASPDSIDCLKHLPVGTVLLIQITPKRELLIADLQIDKKRFRKLNPSDYPNGEYEGYINKIEGIMIRTIKGRVDTIIYMAGKDEHPCPAYLGYSKYFINVFPGLSP